MIIFDYDVECIDKKTREVSYTIPIATTSYKKAKEIGCTWLELVKGVPSIDFTLIVKRVYPGREGVIIREEDLPGYQESKCSYCHRTENLGTQDGIVVCEDCAMGDGQ